MQEIVDHLNPQICAQLKRAIETGRWPDGGRLTREQQALCLQAVMLYEARHLPEEERTGYVDRSRATPCAADAAPDGLIARLRSSDSE
jgi:hypothetical protein